MKGELVDDGSKRMLLVKVRPDYLFIIIQIIILLFAISKVYLFFINHQVLSNTLFHLMVCIVGSLLNYIFALGFSNNLKDNFEAVIMDSDKKVV